jgi:hypothetical protein
MASILLQHRTNIQVDDISSLDRRAELLHQFDSCSFAYFLFTLLHLNNASFDCMVGLRKRCGWLMRLVVV